MKKKIIFFIYFLLSILCVNIINAQISFQAIPQKREVGLQEPIRIQFILSIKNKEVSDIGNIKLPPLNNLQVIGKNIIRNQSYINNDAIIEYGEEISLKAVKPGILKIDPASIKVDGKTYTTQAIKINVTNTITNYEERGKNSSRMGDIFLALRVSDKTPYQNEEIIAQLKFYTKNPELLNSVAELTPPKFTGILAQPIKEKNIGYQQEIINNELYYSRVLASYIILPTKTGNAIIDPFTLTINIPDGFFDEKEVDIKSAPINLQIKKLPSNAPANFYGLVGNYNMKVYSDKQQAKVNEAVTITTEITGNGNIALIKTPELSIPKEIEKYPAQVRSTTKNSLNGVNGINNSTTVLIAHKEGTFNIESGTISYFDPKDGKYKQLSSKPIKLEIKGFITDSKANNSDNQQIEDSTKKFVNVPKVSDVLKTNKEKTLYIIIPFIIALLVFISAVIFIIRHQKKNKEKNIIQNNIPKEEKHNKLPSPKHQEHNIEYELFELKKIAEKGTDREKFYTLAEQLLKKSIYRYFNIQDKQFVTSIEIEEKLINSFGEIFAEECKNLLLKSQIERYYHVYDESSLLDIYNKLEKILHKIPK